MSFNISVLPSGRNFAADTNETILEAAVRQEIGLPYGCRDGACGSCKCKKLSGEVTMSEYQAQALSADDLAQGMILTCRATAHSDVVLESKQVGAANAYPVRKMPARVARLEKLSPDVMRVMLQLPATEDFKYHAGQYIDLILRDGARRSYSMGASATVEQQVELHIRHMPGGKFTDHVFNSLKEKEILRVEGPMGGFYLRNEAEHADMPIALLASGTGFAPIKAVLEELQAQQVTRPITLYWGGRRPEDLYLNDWVIAQCAAMPNLQYIPVISDALPEDHWTGRTGFVHQAILDDYASLKNTQVYACGAPIVVESAHRDFTTQRELPDDQFFADSFVTEKDKHKLTATA